MPPLQAITAFLTLAGGASAQTDPKFEVASIKPAAPVAPLFSRCRGSVDYLNLDGRK